MPISIETFMKEALSYKLEACPHILLQQCKFHLGGFCYYETYKYSTAPAPVEVGNMDCYYAFEVIGPEGDKTDAILE